LTQHPTGFNQVEIRIDADTNKGPSWYSCSGRYFVEKDVTADTFFDDSSTHYLLLSISDITKQRRQQELSYLQSLKTMLAEEEQIRSIRETLLGTIHHVSQPLNQIQAAIQLMKQRDEGGALLELLNQLRDSCQETVSTLQHCVPEIAPTSTTSIQLNQILHDVISLQSNTFLLNSIVVEWHPEATLPNILGAENKMRMLFKQLIDNAINALNRSKSAERVIELKTYSDNNRVYVDVVDTGPGIDPKHLSKIFQPFFTTEKAGAMGSGLGLVMVREIVHQFDGRIDVDAAYKKGCRMTISFPISTKTDSDRYEA
jgi:nitrogen fixation negative regulator NifL